MEIGCDLVETGRCLKNLGCRAETSPQNRFGDDLSSVAAEMLIHASVQDVEGRGKRVGVVSNFSS